MKTLLVFSLLIFFAQPGFSKVVTEIKPVNEYVASAAVNTLKAKQTVNGFLLWAANFLPAKDIQQTRKLIAKWGISESDTFPEFAVRGNRITYKRGSLVINDDHVILNKKRYNFKNYKSFPQFLEGICKDIGCGKDETAFYKQIFFPEAHAIFGISLLGFGLGVITGALGYHFWKKWRDRRKAKKEVKRDPFIQHELVEGRDASDDIYVCHDGSVYIQKKRGGDIHIFNMRGERVIINPEFLISDESCDRQAADLNREALTAQAVNNRNSRTREPPAGARSGFRSVNGAPPEKKD